MENISTEELSVIYEKMGQHLFNLRNWYKIMMRAFNENNGTVSIDTIVGIKHKASVAQAMEVWKSECNNLSYIRQDLLRFLKSQNKKEYGIEEQLAYEKKSKQLVTIELRYEDRPVNEDISRYTIYTITIGVYDTLNEAIQHGNEAINVLSKYFEVRSDDHFAKNALFGMPRRLVSNCCYPTQQISYFAKIIPLHFDDLEEAIIEAFAARERCKRYEQENQD